MAIVREVVANDHDLVIVSAEPDVRNGCGSTAMRLLRKCPCPVWITRSQQSKRIIRVLVPDDAERATLSERVLRLACAIAGAVDKGELHVLHAWTAYGEHLLRGPLYGVDRSEIRRHLTESRLAHQNELDALLKICRTRLPADRVHLVKGDSRLVLPAFCKSEKIDILVMGTAARTGISAAVIGNTAEVVSNNVGCLLVVVKPVRFVCPVEVEPSRERTVSAMSHSDDHKNV